MTIGGIAWCYVIFDRRHRDLQVLRKPNQPADRYIVWGFWGFTGIIFCLVVWRGLLAFKTMIEIFTGWT